MSERRERPSFTLLSLHSCRSSCRHSSSNPHGMNECSERVTWGEGGRDRDADRHEERSEVTKEPDPRSVPPPFIPPSLRSVALSLRSFPPPFARGASGGYGEGGG